MYVQMLPRPRQVPWIREAAHDSAWWCGQEVASYWILSSRLIVDT